ncbi:hypothetical protein Bca52824_056330 [Brassica carinata]|uniref:Uncharacterized protein n=1 Tax=Brassica carinata TaxID=52824 RepID=A0A8X7QST8_BRACI|nr:hypothetical protein Bca52824_056330 [Brassica carinata]
MLDQGSTTVRYRRRFSHGEETVGVRVTPYQKPCRIDVDNFCVYPFGKLVKISEKLSRALDKSILGEEVEEDEMLMVLQITIICLSGKLAFK